VANGIKGSFFVRATRSALSDVDHLFPRISDRMEIRRQALKLRYWPAPVTTEVSGYVVDLDWSWVRGLDGQKVGELRIHDTIGGMDNLRLIFFVGPASTKFPKTCIWILSVFQKKRDDFTQVQMSTFRLRRLAVVNRFYSD
jgi:hypothetical protein